MTGKNSGTPFVFIIILILISMLKTLLSFCVVLSLTLSLGLQVASHHTGHPIVTPYILQIRTYSFKFRDMNCHP